MTKLVSSDFNPPPAEIKSMPTAQSPVLTRDAIIKSLSIKKLGPIQGKPIVGKGGLKPYRKPADGTKVVAINSRLRKPLRAPQQRKI